MPKYQFWSCVLFFFFFSFFLYFFFSFLGELGNYKVGGLFRLQSLYMVYILSMFYDKSVAIKMEMQALLLRRIYCQGQ